MIDLGSKVNTMTPAYTSKLSLKVHPTNIGAQKIDSSTLKIFRIVLASFQVENKPGKTQFVQKIFLIVNISAEIVLSIFFLIFNNTDVQFIEKKLIWRSYTAAEALSTTKQVELINKNEFAKVTLDENFEIFVIYVTSLNLTSGLYLNKVAQITSLLTEKVKILDEYSDFANVFLEEKALVLPERTELNEYAINL